MAEDSTGRGSAAARDLSKQEPSAPHHRMMSERANNLLADFPRGDRSKGVAAGRKTSAMRVNARIPAEACKRYTVHVHVGHVVDLDRFNGIYRGPSDLLSKR